MRLLPNQPRKVIHLTGFPALRGSIKTCFHLCLGLLFFSWVSEASAQSEPGLTFCCAPGNDLFVALEKAGRRCARFDLPEEAIRTAPANSAVLVLADNYPAQRVRLSPALLELSNRKNQRLYLEFPEALPGLAFQAPRVAEWERGVVTTNGFGERLPALRVLGFHSCHYLPVTATNVWIAGARVTGYDTAVFGLPTNAFPVLFEVPGRRWLVATTKLSGFLSGRYAPVQDWQQVWETILGRLAPAGAPFKLAVTPTVKPAFGADDPLPPDAEQQAFAAAAGWIKNSGLLVTPSRRAGIAKALAANGESEPIPSVKEPAGDGSLGILEGYASGIAQDGTQLQRLPLRQDCNLECATVLALDGPGRSRQIASNLLDFVYFTSGMCQGARADPKHGAFGMVAWGDISPAWLCANYGDDACRGILGTVLAGASLKTERWDEMVAKALLANFRTTGKLGFRGDRIDLPALEQYGWKHFRDAETVNYAPHFEGGLWACYLWAYAQTGFSPFLHKTTNALAMTMKAYPSGWRWGDNIERARILPALAWLVRVEDTAEHRQWLRTVTGDLLKHQQPSGAIREWVAGTGGGHYRIPQSNEAYGTGETPLIQKNGDPVSDQLYTTGFVLFGLHEAVAALKGDDQLQVAEDKLAAYLVRIQIRSDTCPWLNGWWFRAFDDQRWESWASSADIGWGAWSLEAGWAQAWTAVTFALRQQKTTYWALTANSRVAGALKKWRPIMLEEVN
jgi:hypothetical protein